MRRCPGSITRLRRHGQGHVINPSLKSSSQWESVKSIWPSYLDSRSSTQVKGFTLKFRVSSISPEPFGQFSPNFTQMFLSVRQCAELNKLLRRLKVKVTLQGHVIYPSVCVHSISLESLEQFSLNFTQMFLSVRRCAEPRTQLRKLKVKVTLQGYGIYPWILCPLNLLNHLFDFH